MCFEMWFQLVDHVETRNKPDASWSHQLEPIYHVPKHGYQSMLDNTQIHVLELPSPSSSVSMASMASMVAGGRGG